MSDIDISYGGQAVIGGVLIQSPKGWSLGIRDKDDNLHRYYEPRIPLVRRNKFWAAPFIRGFGALIDSMYVGFKAITLSEKIYSKFEDEEESLLSKVVTYSVLIAVLLLFIAGPRLLVEMINYAQIGTGIIEGLFRGVIVIIYIYLIGRTKDAQELFEYHGAEHMTIASYEDKQSLEFDNVTNYPKEHVRYPRFSKIKKRKLLAVLLEVSQDSESKNSTILLSKSYFFRYYSTYFKLLYKVFYSDS